MPQKPASPLKRPRKGQRWRNKKTGLALIITGTQGDWYKTKDAYGSRVSHTINEFDLFKYWELLP